MGFWGTTCSKARDASKTVSVEVRMRTNGVDDYLCAAREGLVWFDFLQRLNRLG